MTLLRRAAACATVLMLGGLGAGCLVQIEHMADPGPAFRDARAEAARYQGRPGPAHQLNVLVFDRDEEKLVRVSLPMWLARRIADHADHHGDFDADFDQDRDQDRDRAERAVRRHVRFEDIERAGLGILVEVQEERGDQVLVWLK
jgi:hypothetical protein